MIRRPTSPRPPSRRVRGAALFGAALLLAGSGRAAVVEEQLDVAVEVVDGYGKTLAAPVKVSAFVDPDTPSPHPILVINHGRPSEAPARAALGRYRPLEIVRWFARLGFVVAVPTRLGYGATGGEDVEDSGACTRKVYAPGYEAAAQQTLAVIEAMRARADTVKDRTVVVGQSYGGATSVAVAARNPPGIVASINFAGGGGGNPKTSAREPCAPVLLKRLFADYGRTARLPMLWVYTENDQFWGAQYPKDWLEAFRDGGGSAEFVQFPPHGDDGHLLFTRFPAVWQPAVRAFLDQRGFDLKGSR
jgi:dienelactone hydrolase